MNKIVRPVLAVLSANGLSINGLSVQISLYCLKNMAKILTSRWPGSVFSFSEHHGSMT